MLAARRFFRREQLIGGAVALVLGCVAFVYGLRWLDRGGRIVSESGRTVHARRDSLRHNRKRRRWYDRLTRDTIAYADLNLILTESP